MSTPTSVEQIVNEALTRVGYPERISNIYEGTRQARAALDVYAQTRDELLRQEDWDFAQKIAAAVLSGAVAPAPWTTEYDYPSDCLRLRNLWNASYLADKNDPLPVLWSIGNNSLGAKVIWCKLAAATLVYTTQLTDLTKWEPLFVEALITALGKRLVPALKNALADPGADEKEAAAMAESVIG